MDVDAPMPSLSSVNSATYMPVVGLAASPSSPEPASDSPPSPTQRLTTLAPSAALASDASATDVSDRSTHRTPSLMSSSITKGKRRATSPAPDETPRHPPSSLTPVAPSSAAGPGRPTSPTASPSVDSPTMPRARDRLAFTPTEDTVLTTQDAFDIAAAIDAEESAIRDEIYERHKLAREARDNVEADDASTDEDAQLDRIKFVQLSTDEQGLWAAGASRDSDQLFLAPDARMLIRRIVNLSACTIIFHVDPQDVLRQAAIIDVGRITKQLPAYCRREGVTPREQYAARVWETRDQEDKIKIAMIAGGWAQAAGGDFAFMHPGSHFGYSRLLVLCAANYPDLRAMVDRLLSIPEVFAAIAVERNAEDAYDSPKPSFDDDHQKRRAMNELAEVKELGKRVPPWEVQDEYRRKELAVFRALFNNFAASHTPSEPLLGYPTEYLAFYPSACHPSSSTVATFGYFRSTHPTAQTLLPQLDAILSSGNYPLPPVFLPHHHRLYRPFDDDERVQLQQLDEAGRLSLLPGRAAYSTEGALADATKLWIMRARLRIGPLEGDAAMLSESGSGVPGTPFGRPFCTTTWTEDDLRTTALFEYSDRRITQRAIVRHAHRQAAQATRAGDGGHGPGLFEEFLNEQELGMDEEKDQELPQDALWKTERELGQERPPPDEATRAARLRDMVSDVLPCWMQPALAETPAQMWLDDRVWTTITAHHLAEFFRGADAETRASLFPEEHKVDVTALYPLHSSSDIVRLLRRIAEYSRATKIKIVTSHRQTLVSNILRVQGRLPLWLLSTSTLIRFFKLIGEVGGLRLALQSIRLPDSILGQRISNQQLHDITDSLRRQRFRRAFLELGVEDPDDPLVTYWQAVEGLKSEQDVKLDRERDTAGRSVYEHVFDRMCSWGTEGWRRRTAREVQAMLVDECGLGYSGRSTGEWLVDVGLEKLRDKLKITKTEFERSMGGRVSWRKDRKYFRLVT